MKFNFSLILFLFVSTTLLAQKKRNNEFGVTLGSLNYKFYSKWSPFYGNYSNDNFSYSTLFNTKKT